LYRIFDWIKISHERVVVEWDQMVAQGLVEEVDETDQEDLENSS
jgi:DNA-binding PadR family transcriptional regulator